jgi:hypothetical protein
MKQDDIPCQQSGILSLYGGTEVSEGFPNSTVLTAM